MQEIQAIGVAVQLRTPVLVWGATGIGKSSAMRYIANKLQMKLIDLPLEVLEPFDLAGFPKADDQFTQYLPPSWVAQVEPGKTIIFLDELASIPEVVQRAARRLIQMKQVGFVQLEDVAIVAASNRPEHDILARPLPKSLYTRFIQIDFSADKWVELYERGWKVDIPIIQRNDEKGGGLVRAFLYAFPAYRESEEEGYRACPRTWVDFVVPVLGSTAPDAIKELLIAGAVGPGIAMKLMNWLKTLNFPKLDEMIQRPELFETLSFDQQWAVVEAVIPYATREQAEKMWELICNHMKPEMQVVAFKHLLTKFEDLIPPEKYGAKIDKLIEQIF